MEEVHFFITLTKKGSNRWDHSSREFDKLSGYWSENIRGDRNLSKAPQRKKCSYVDKICNCFQDFSQKPLPIQKRKILANDHRPNSHIEQKASRKEKEVPHLKTTKLVSQEILSGRLLVVAFHSLKLFNIIKILTFHCQSLLTRKQPFANVIACQDKNFFSFFTCTIESFSNEFINRNVFSSLIVSHHFLQYRIKIPVTKIATLLRNLPLYTRL